MIRCGCENVTIIEHWHRGSLFLQREVATIECTVTGRRKYSADLAQGGLEVPCSLLFKVTLMEPVGSESPLLGLKQFLINITKPGTK